MTIRRLPYILIILGLLASVALVGCKDSNLTPGQRCELACDKILACTGHVDADCDRRCELVTSRYSPCDLVCETDASCEEFVGCLTSCGN